MHVKPFKFNFGVYTNNYSCAYACTSIDDTDTHDGTVQDVYKINYYACAHKILCILELIHARALANQSCDYHIIGKKAC